MTIAEIICATCAVLPDGSVSPSDMRGLSCRPAVIMAKNVAAALVMELLGLDAQHAAAALGFGIDGERALKRIRFHPETRECYHQAKAVLLAKESRER